MQIAAQVQALQQCGTGELRRKYRELFGEDARSWNRSYLPRIIHEGFGFPLQAALFDA